jgi:hypothetical protein
MADQLATPADLASLLQRDVDTASATLAIEVSTAVVQAAVDRQRIIQVVDDTTVIDLGPDHCGLYLDLPDRPVTAVSSVTIGTTAVTDFVLQASKNRLWRALGWRPVGLTPWYSPWTVTVINTHGLASGDQKLQLARGAVLSLARGLFTNPDGTVREQIDDYQVAYAEASASLDAAPALKAALRKQYGRRAAMVRVV